MKVNTLACEAVLADLLRLYDNGIAMCGLGVLCLRLHRDAQESSFISLEDLRADRDTANQSGSTDLESFLLGVIDQIEGSSPDRVALILLLDNSSAQLFPVSKEYPARSIQALMEEYAA